MRSGKACASRSPMRCASIDRRRLRIDLQAPAPLFRGGIECGEAGAAAARVVSAAECGQRAPAFGEGIAARAQRIARFDQCREIARERAVFVARRRKQHRGQARMRAEREHAAAERRDRHRHRARPVAATDRARHRARRQAAHRRSDSASLPHAASSSAREASSTCAISGRRCGSRRCDCGHRRYVQPSATRPARPAR